MKKLQTNLKWYQTIMIFLLSLTIIGLIILLFWNKRKTNASNVANDYIDKYIPSGKILELIDDKTREFQAIKTDGVETDEVIESIAEDVDMAKDKTKEILDAFVKVIVKIVAAGEKVIVQGFGTFELEFEQDKKNLIKKMVPDFKPSKIFIESINEEVITGIL